MEIYTRNNVLFFLVLVTEMLKFRQMYRPFKIQLRDAVRCMYIVSAIKLQKRLMLLRTETKSGTQHEYR